MAIGRTQMKTQLQGNRKMKKYQAGMGVMTSPRPKMRPKDMEKMAAMKKVRPKARPKNMAPMVEEGSTRSPDNINMNERAARGELMPKMKKGGKIRGYGMARGGKVCKMR